MEQDHGWCHSLYYLDPNGIMVELCRDTPGFEPDRASLKDQAAVFLRDAIVSGKIPPGTKIAERSVAEMLDQLWERSGGRD